MSAARFAVYKQKLLHGFLESLAGKELHDSAGRDLDLFVGAGIAASARGALHDLEAAEAHQSDGVAGSKAFRNGRNDSIKSFFGFDFSFKAALGVYLFDQFSFRHVLSPKKFLAPLWRPFFSRMRTPSCQASYDKEIKNLW